MNWEQQQAFLQQTPELHSLLAAYIAVEDDWQDAVTQFVAENKPEVVVKVIQDLQACLQGSVENHGMLSLLSDQDLDWAAIRQSLIESSSR